MLLDASFQQKSSWTLIIAFGRGEFHSEADRISGNQHNSVLLQTLSCWQIGQMAEIRYLSPCVRHHGRVINNLFTISCELLTISRGT